MHELEALNYGLQEGARQEFIKIAASTMVVGTHRLGALLAKKRRFHAPTADLVQKVAEVFYREAVEGKLANVSSARGQLAKSVRRSGLKVTLSGPSVQAMAKPTGFGRAIPGATKGV